MNRVWKVLAVTGAIGASISILIGALLFSEVQVSRKESVRISCEEQNVRHDETIETLDGLLALRAPSASEAELERLKQSRTNTILLIDALAPRRNCAERVEQLTE